jgi:membrane protein YqaA with SNARE-associated domain
VTHLFTAVLTHSLRKYLRHIGALAFFPLGLLDMSVIPAPGSFDILLIVLTAAHKELWWYYALMATAGSVFGASASFKLARKGGEETIAKRLSPRVYKKVLSAFRRWGFWSLFVGAIAPPPMPASAFVLTAGALGYPWPNFLLCWTLGRLLRFGLVAWITMHYGRHIFHGLRGFYLPALWTMILLGAAAGAAALWFYLRARRRAAHAPGPNRRAA